MFTFVPGKTYQTRSICDHECIYTIKVLSRTAKRIKAQIVDRDNQVKTLGISEYDGSEYVMPFGRYSMAPMIRASKPGPDGY